MKKLVYADNAATTRLSDNAMEAMLPWLKDSYGNASQPYAFSRDAKQAIRTSRELIADCIGAFPDEIYFTSGGTESNNWVIKNACLEHNERNEIITSAIEHHAIINACEFEAKYRGRSVKYLPVTSDGVVLPEFLSSSLGNYTGLVSVMTINNEIGTVEPIKDLTEIAHTSGCLFHTDAVQAIGHCSLNVHDIDVDFLSSSAHKFNGPKGVGFLYIKNGSKLLPLIHGGSQERGHRAGTENIAGIVGMSVALEENISSLNINNAHIISLEEKLEKLLSYNGIEYIRNGSSMHKPGIISLSFAGAEGEAIMHRMDLMGVSISTGSACDSKNTQVSHVLKAIHLSEKLAKGTIRISLGKDNTEEDVEVISKALVKILS